ncbi:MAG: dienelactone hydrolase family protein [Burkholderiales bacterium]|nr:dienelactone hydrolase family protein [Burkholderiales bacterium]
MGRCPRLTRLLAAALCLCASAAAQAAPETLQVDSLDNTHAGPVKLPAYWFAADAKGAAPAMLLLHGCGGPYDGNGRLSLRMREYAELLNAQGIHVLVTDSLTPRGERELCTQKAGSRSVTQLNRRRDALGALQWLAARPDVDARQLGVMGWSNGGSNVLAATNDQHPEVHKAAVKPSFAVAFYPGCEDEFKRGYQPVAPLLMLLGAVDDWTPAEPCQALASAASAPKPEFETYAGAYHGFDGTAPVVLRRDVPNGTHPGQGVHVGTDPAARTASRERLLKFLREQGVAK